MELIERNKCKLCAKTYVRAKDLNRHIRMIHDDKRIETYHCCGSVFKYKSSFKRHQLSHVIREAENSTPVGLDSFKCDDCGTVYWRKEDVRRHIVRKHLRSIRVRDEIYECHDCMRKFKRKSSLLRHIEHLHLSEQEVQVKKNRCIECGKLFSLECLLIGHYRNDHSLLIEEEELFFNDNESFTDWKRQMEENTWSAFTKAGTRRTKKYSAIIQYVCHRRGFHLPPENPKRRSSQKGSKKINGICPAKILRFLNSDGSCRVSFVKTHLGHPLNYQELAHVPHSSEVIDSVVTKVRAGVPVKEILKLIVPKCPPVTEETRKIHLLSAKDIRNITTTRNLRSTDHSNDVTKEEAFSFEGVGCEPSRMEETRKIHFSSLRDIHNISILPDVEDPVYDFPNDVIENREDVVFYKKENESYPGWEVEDFVLVLMKNEQRRMLEIFGSDIIILDSTHGTDKAAFVLHTLWVLNDYKEGYPCAFLITNRNDKIVTDFFFICIKEKLRITMYPEVFVSDMEDTFYDSWCEIMAQQPRYHFVCTWRIKKEWFTNLNRIKSADQRKRVGSILEKLRIETNPQQFEMEIVEFLMSDDSDLREFLDYFFINYFESRKQWAYCYRPYAGINTDIALERFRGVMKRGFKEGITLKNIGELLSELDEYVEEKYRESRQNEVCGKLTKKIRLLRRSHDIAKAHLTDQKPVVLEKTDESSWKISSFTNPEKMYYIVKGRTCDLCKIVCHDCCEHLCAHSFRCSCVENSIKDVMCEHIHYLLLRTPLQQIENSLLNTEEVQLQIVDGNEYLKEVATNENNQSRTASPIPDELRERIVSSIQKEYNQIVAKAKNEEQLQFLYSELKKINESINAMESPTTGERKCFNAKKI